jgi:putative ABC transport system substrate-binding protein
MRQRGWREGVDYVVESRDTRGDPARALALARELVEHRVDLVLAITTAPAVAFRQVSDRIPVVAWCGYPVEAGLAKSLAQPGGNVTGVANYASGEVWGKFVELLLELKPGLRNLGLLWDYVPPAFPDGLVPLPEIRGSAQKIGIKTRTWMIEAGDDLAAALSSTDVEAVEALIITAGSVHHQPQHLDKIGAFLARRRLPAITDVASLVFGRGCVLAYSPNLVDTQIRLADFVDRILRGGNPPELPFERPSRFELAVDLKVAQKLEIAVPQSLLLRADRVVE